MRVLGMIVLAILLLSPPAFPQERSREGFSRVMGLGLVGAHSSELADAGIDADRFGLHVDTRMGSHLADRWALHWSGRAVWLLGSGSSALASAMVGIQTTYYTRDEAPSYYLSGLVGPAWTVALSSDAAAVGWAGTVAVGYEWRRNHSVEFEVFLGLPDPGDPYKEEVSEGRLPAASIKLVSYFY